MADRQEKESSEELSPTRDATRSKAIPWVMGLGILTFSIGILAAAYMGSFMRLSGDDYCFGGVIQEYGFFQAQANSYRDALGDRYSFIFVSGLASTAGPMASAALPALTLIGWLAAATWCGWQLAKWARLPRPLLLALWGAAAVVFLTIYQAPDRVESVYWRSANIPYLVPLVLDWVLLGLILKMARDSRVRPLGLLAAMLLAFVVGGFSEAAASFQITWLVLALAVALALRHRLPADGRPLASALVAAVVGAGLALAVEAASPFARHQLEGLRSDLSAPVLLVTAFRSGWAFLRETLEGLPVPTAVTLALSGALGALLALEGRFEQRRRWVGLMAGAIILLGAAVVLAAAVAAPSLYARGFLPNPRAQFASRHAMVLAFVGIGLAAGFVAGAILPTRWKRSPLLPGALAVAMIVLAFFPLWGAHQLVADAPTYRRWAEAWDARHAAILEARAAGENDIHVTQIGTLIRWVSDLDEQPTSWYNACAAGHYGVLSITADPPG